MFNPRLLRSTAEEEDQSENQINQATGDPLHALPSVQMMAFRPMNSAPANPGLNQPPIYYNQMQMNQVNMMPPMFPLQSLPFGFGGPINQGQNEAHSNYGFPMMQQYLGIPQNFTLGAPFSLPSQHANPDQKSKERPQELPKVNISQDNRHSRGDDRNTGNPTTFAKLGSYNKQQDKGSSYSRENYGDRRQRDDRGSSFGVQKQKPSYASSNPYADDYPEKSNKPDRSPKNLASPESSLGKRSHMPSADRENPIRLDAAPLDISDEDEDVDEEALYAKNVEKVGEEKLALAGLIAPGLNTPEEIHKWIQARKHNYPTRAKIAQKEKELIACGESGKLKESELSRLEVRLRKKLLILDYDPIQERNRQRDKRKLLERIGRKTKMRRTGKHDQPAGKPEIDSQKRPKNQQQDIQAKKTESPKWQVNNEPMQQTKPSKVVSATTADETNDEGSETENLEQLRYSLSDSSDELSSEDDRPPVEVCMKKEVGVLAAMGAKEEDLTTTKKELEVEPTIAFKKPPTKPTLTPESIIAHLMSRREEDSSAIENFMKAKSSTRHFKRQQGSLLSNLLVEDVYKERDTILQTLRYIIKSNFLKNPPKDLGD